MRSTFAKLVAVLLVLVMATCMMATVFAADTTDPSTVPDDTTAATDDTTAATDDTTAATEPEKVVTSLMKNRGWSWGPPYDHSIDQPFADITLSVPATVAYTFYYEDGTVFRAYSVDLDAGFHKLNWHGVDENGWHAANARVEYTIKFTVTAADGRTEVYDDMTLAIEYQHSVQSHIDYTEPVTTAPTTVPPTTVAPTTVPPTTVAPTTVPPTTVAPTTAAPTTEPDVPHTGAADMGWILPMTIMVVMGLYIVLSSKSRKA